MEREHEWDGHQLVGDNWPESWDNDPADAEELSSQDELYEELEREAEMERDYMLAQQELDDFEGIGFERCDIDDYI